ncbi:A-kinase anchor protein 8-like isoform X1 [Eumetopias jubatus]|uniref:A-kinase anchor protein 8-like isoform X1 n=2 Tax=Eumetopias jubatus TaxID=34886 RepID=UPI001016F6B5|nr:A-kinase anchor protein 8-like isoform X1 [Eumetopias jubatus]
MSYTGFVQGSETTLQSTYSDTSAQPTCDYGYGTWNSGTNRGYENYGYGYGYGQDNTANYGYGTAASDSWEMPNSDTNANPSAAGSAGADSVLSRINQRLDLVPHLETDMIQGGVYGSGGERYDSYEACDSRAILSERDLYRSGYDYGELDPEMEMAYEGQYDAYRDQFRMRGGDTFGPRAQGWARDSRSGRPMASGYGRMWEDPMGARGQCMPGASRLPSLFSQNIIPEYSMFQGMRGGGAFPGGSRFGFGFGNGMKQMRRTWKTWTTADFRTKKKKRKQCGSPDEPDSKATRTDCSDNSDSDNDEGTEGEAAEGTEGTEAVEKGSRAEGEDEEGKEEGKEESKEDVEKGALSTQDDSGQIKRKLQAGKKSQDKQKKRQRDRMVERIQFVCSLCKYRTFYEEEMASHLDSKFHKEHFKYVGTKLPKQTADFLQEYVTNKTKKTEELRKTVEDLDGLIQQIYRDQDLTQVWDHPEAPQDHGSQPQPQAHDGAVQEVLAHGGPQHPQQQNHQQEAGALPEGEASRPLAPGPRGSFPPFSVRLLPHRVRTRSPIAPRRRRNRRRPRAAPWTRGRWSRGQGARRVQRARRRSPQCPRSRLPGPRPHRRRRRRRRKRRGPCPCWAGRFSARSAVFRASMWRPTTTRRVAGAHRNPGSGRAGPAWPNLEAEPNKALPIPLTSR